MSNFTTMQFLELRVPPLVVALFMAGLGWITAWMSPRFDFIIPYQRVAVLTVVASGICVALLGASSFRRARTTLNPLKPRESSRLVTSGIYRRTRNPMYLGMLMVLLGWAFFLSNLLVFLFLPAFILYMNRLQIAPEERVLASMFGQEFSAYQTKVRRWL